VTSSSSAGQAAYDGARARLLADRERTADHLAALTRDHDGIVAASESSNADDEHDPEGATIAFEREQIAALLGQARSSLEELDRALARVEDGSYGTCQVCGQAIAPERLEARPAATTCIACASPRSGRSSPSSPGRR
jgi:RNA polymerase-binding transcription factor DksA